MARLFKKGINYFSVDINFFESDEIWLVEGEHGILASSVAIRLLCKIFREGFYYKWGEDECILFAQTIRDASVSTKYIHDVVHSLVKRNFFEKRLFNEFGILTSERIQENFFEATRRYKRVDVIEEYLLIDTSLFNKKNIIMNSINADINS